MTDEQAALIKDIAERTADEVHAIYAPVLADKDETIAALEQELDEARGRIEALLPRMDDTGSLIREDY